jgi:hypothetical protein
MRRLQIVSDAASVGQRSEDEGLHVFSVAGLAQRLYANDGG